MSNDYYSKRTLVGFAEDVRRLNRIGVTKGAARQDSEWFIGHPLASLSSEAREALEAYLERITPRRAVTATAILVSPDALGFPHQLLGAWLSKFPADAVITRESDAPLTLRATWTEQGW